MALPYKVTTVQDQPLNVSISRLRWNMSDPDGDPTYFTAVGQTSDAGGTILDLGGASVTYTPPAGFVGSDRFAYTIEDEIGATATADVQVEVTPKTPAASRPTIAVTTGACATHCGPLFSGWAGVAGRSGGRRRIGPPNSAWTHVFLAMGHGRVV